jgi:hypothetical protein
MCVLRVSGRGFDPGLYLSQSRLTAHKVFRAGEPRSTSRPQGRPCEVSGLVVEVSRRSGAYLFDQVADAIGFLEEHEQDIAKLRMAPGVDDMRLDFQVDLRIDRDKVMAQFDYFPPKLVSRAGALGLGLEISIYPADLLDLAEAKASEKRVSESDWIP